MRKPLWAVAACWIALALVLAACGGTGGTANTPSPAAMTSAPSPTAMASATSAPSPAARTVENYLAALVSKDAAKVSNLACKAWEQDALLEMDGFQAVKAELDNVSCKATGTAGDATLVSCTGNIALTYNNELQSLDVSRQTYKVIQEGGDYRVCGYQ